jgi:hypothetical protein
MITYVCYYLHLSEAVAGSTDGTLADKAVACEVIIDVQFFNNEILT